MQLLQSTCNTDKQNLWGKIGEVEKKVPDVSALVTTAVLKTNISEIENKILDASGLVLTTSLNTKNGEVENKIQDVSKIQNTKYQMVQ